jgi:hypothetical protein
MADLNYRFTGVNKAQLANEVRLLRQNSGTFRALEAAAAAAGYKTIEIQMAADLLPGDIADSTKTDSSTRTIRINSDATGSWGTGGRQATVGEVIAHELAHAVVPKEFEKPSVWDPGESGTEGMWVRRQAGQVARDLGLPGANNADHLITRIPINETQGCTVQRPQGDGARDGVLFLDGSRGYNGIGAVMPPGSGSPGPTNSRRLAIDEPAQELPPGASGDPSAQRRLTRVTPPQTAISLENSRTFGDRLGNWSSFPVGIAPLPPSDRPASFGDRFSFPADGPAPAPQPSGSETVRILSRSIVGQPQAPVIDTSAPAPSLAPSDENGFSGGLPGRLIALGGIDPQNPTQPAPSPLDDQLRGFYRDDPLQPCLVRRQR